VLPVGTAQLHMWLLCPPAVLFVLAMYFMFRVPTTPCLTCHLPPPPISACRADVEYKYIVQWDDGRVARWQDGPNNSLAVQHPGVLMHVQDTWSQQDRSVREVGMRLTHDQQQRQSGGHSSGAAATNAAAAPPAAAVASSAVADHGTPSAEALTVQAAAEAATAAAAAPPSSSGSGAALAPTKQQPNGAHAAAAAVMPIQSTWEGVLPLPQHPLVFDHFGHFDTAAAEDDEELHYEDEEEDQHWPAEMLQKAATAAAAASALLAAPAHPAAATSAAAAAHQGGTTVPAQSAAGTSTGDNSTRGSSPAFSSSSKQQQGVAGSLAELLPLLRTELEAALAELAKHPEAPHEHGNLLTEGHAVLAALQQQQQTATASGASMRPKATSGATSSSSGSGSPGRSPSSTLVSGDEIAAALLSDDCEEACFCMVDAICSCSDWNLSCSCDSDPDTPCELSDAEDGKASLQHAQHSGQAAHKHTAAHRHAPAQHEGAASPAAAPVPALSLAELARAAAIAARHDPYSLAARAAAFSDVQTALEKSASLLSALSDPCHPLMLEADRKLATASRQLHGGKMLQ
jgi:hypothetical protein